MTITLTYPERIVKALTDARDLLAQPGVWIQGDYAHGRDGTAHLTVSAGAVRFCALGALSKVCHDDQSLPHHRAYDYLAEALPEPLTHTGRIGYWNDRPGRKVKSVIALYDRAIALVRRDQLNGDFDLCE